MLRLRDMDLKREFIPQFSICDNQWHTLSVRSGGTWVELVVDGDMQQQRSVNRPDSRDSLHTLYIGGNPDITSGDMTFSMTTRSFMGCIRNVVLNGTPVRDFSTLPSLQDVVPDQCPRV
ncbi:contactin-associated protein-like 4 [Amphiura filiformis]|uniref:contactin-associated protein-like 4 n=1 Tax=Amphiura filiformis TaxID=82378 RepID=UPI003B216E49